MPRFAILKHDYPTLHWDFLLEHADVLLTWRLSALPQSSVVVDAVKLSDHRRLYLDYEGAVSGGRGEVSRWDGGTFDWEVREADCLAVSLCGSRLQGVFRLELLTGESWRGEFLPNQPAAQTTGFD